MPEITIGRTYQIKVDGHDADITVQDRVTDGRYRCEVFSPGMLTSMIIIIPGEQLTTLIDSVVAA